MTDELPPGWAETRLSEITEVRLGRQRSPARAFGEHMVPYLRAANVTWRGLDLSDVKSMDFRPSEQEIYRLVSGDILLSEASGSPGEVGKPAIWRGEIKGCCFQNTLLRVRAPAELTKFLYFHFLDDAMHGRFGGDSRGVNINHLGAERLSRWIVRVPPLDEQRRIVEAIEEQFTRLDAVIEGLKRVQRELKRYRASVLKAACEGRLVPTEAELARANGRAYEPADRLLARILEERRAQGGARYKAPQSPRRSGLQSLPDGWTWATIEQLVSPAPRSIQSGPFGSALLHSEFQETGVLAIGIDNVLDGKFVMGRQHRISPEKFRTLEKFRARPADVLITVMATVGRCCVVPEDLEPAIITKHVYRMSVDRRVLHPGYLMYGLLGGTEVLHQMWGEVKGQTRPGINGEILRRLTIPLPPLAEQERIVAEVEQRLSVVEKAEAAVEANLKRAERMRQAILKRAFEGKLVPQDPKDEPASVLLEHIRAEREQATATTPKWRGRRSAAQANQDGPERNRQLRLLDADEAVAAKRRAIGRGRS